MGRLLLFDSGNPISVLAVLVLRWWLVSRGDRFHGLAYSEPVFSTQPASPYTDVTTRLGVAIVARKKWKGLGGRLMSFHTYLTAAQCSSFSVLVLSSQGSG